MTRRARPLAVLAAFGLAVAAEAQSPAEFPPVVPPPDVAAILPVAAAVTELPVTVLSLPPAPAPELNLPARPPTAAPACGYFAAEALCWNVTGQQLPPLVTVGPAGAPLPTAGVLGAPGTRTVLGGDDLAGHRAGMRLTAGLWLDCRQKNAFEVSAFVLDAESADRPFQSAGDPVLARPLFDAVAAAQASKLIGFPDLVAGSVIAHTESHLWGVEANFREVLGQSADWTIEGLVGYRFVRLSDRVGIQEVETVTGPNVLPVGAVLALRDEFRTRNTFHGGQVGLAVRTESGPWSWGGLAKVAVGTMNQVVNIAGQSTFTPPGGSAVATPGGLLALSSNIGHYTRNRTAVVPEFGLSAGYCVSSHLRLTAGYTALFLPDVVRAAEQIDLNINPALLPPALPTTGPRRPAFLGFPSTDAWVQGVAVGATVSW